MVKLRETYRPKCSGAYNHRRWCIICFLSTFFVPTLDLTYMYLWAKEVHVSLIKNMLCYVMLCYVMLPAFRIVVLYDIFNIQQSSIYTLIKSALSDQPLILPTSILLATFCHSAIHYSPVTHNNGRVPEPCMIHWSQDLRLNTGIFDVSKSFATHIWLSLHVQNIY